MPVPAITSLEDFKAITNGSKPVVIDFWAEWCGPCHMIAPLFEQHSVDPDLSNVAFYKVNVDNCDDIAAECGIRSMPTFMVFKDGAKIDELIGANKQGLQNLVLKTSGR